jgi:hypothetical protein
MGPHSWAASIVGFALAVLAASVMLQLAAEYLMAALPVLLLTAALVVLGLIGWHFYRRPRNW